MTNVAPLIVAGALLLAACTAAPAAPVGTSASSAPTTAGATPVAASAAVTPAPAASKATATLDVQLAFSGTVAITISGAVGMCTMGQHVDGSGAVFGYQATGADQANLGDGFFIDEDLANGTRVAVKFLPPDGPWFGYMPATFSADHHTMTLDTDLPVHPDKPEHVKGTITCP